MADDLRLLLAKRCSTTPGDALLDDKTRHRACLLSVLEDRCMNDWKPDGEPFFWVPKAAFERIEENLELGPAGSAKLVFVALCIIANRQGNATISKPINYIAKIASLERRTIRRRIHDLKRLGLVTVEREGCGEIYSYTLRTLSPKVGTQSPTVGTARRVHPVPLPKELKEQGERPRPLTNVERISADRQKADLQAEIRNLRGETSEPWQRQENPELLTKLRDKQAQLEALNERLALV